MLLSNSISSYGVGFSHRRMLGSDGKSGR